MAPVIGLSEFTARETLCMWTHISIFIHKEVFT